MLGKVATFFLEIDAKSFFRIARLVIYEPLSHHATFISSRNPWEWMSHAKEILLQIVAEKTLCYAERSYVKLRCFCRVWLYLKFF